MSHPCGWEIVLCTTPCAIWGCTHDKPQTGVVKQLIMRQPGSVQWNIVEKGLGNVHGTIGCPFRINGKRVGRIDTVGSAVRQGQNTTSHRRRTQDVVRIGQPNNRRVPGCPWQATVRQHNGTAVRRQGSRYDDNNKATTKYKAFETYTEHTLIASDFGGGCSVWVCRGHGCRTYSPRVTQTSQADICPASSLPEMPPGPVLYSPAAMCLTKTCVFHGCPK